MTAQTGLGAPVDPTHGNGLWDPSLSPMPYYVKGAIILALILLGCLFVEVCWLAYRMRK